ncbi:MAG: hypothetical protein V1676_02575 [Candidatus Diapherotrites archaeon]
MMNFNGTGGSTKEVVVSILAKEFPLSAKEIHGRLMRQHSSEISYQAVHKLLSQMEEEGMLSLADKKYSLGIDWIKNLKKFSTGLEDAYLNNGKNNFDNIWEKESASLSFDCLSDFSRFIVYRFHNAPNPKNKPGVCRWWSAWPTFPFSEEDYIQARKNIKRTKFYLVARNNTAVDRMIASNYADLGAKIKLGVESSFSPEVVVYGDYVGYVYLPARLKRDWYRISTIARTFAQLKLGKLFGRLFKGKTEKFRIDIHRDPEVTDQIREETIALFKEAK